MNRNIVLGFLVMLAGVAAGWYLLSGKPVPRLPTYEQLSGKIGPTSTPTMDLTDAIVNVTSPGGTEGADKGGVAARTVVTYTDTGFGPSSIVVAAGTIVTFVNESGKGMWVASDVHPTHLLLPEFDAKKSLGKGASYEFTFMKVGTWRYHNHVNPSDGGTVVVTQ